MPVAGDGDGYAKVVVIDPVTGQPAGGGAGGTGNIYPGSNYATTQRQDSMLTSLGVPADAAFAGTGSAGLISILKGIYARFSTPSAALTVQRSTGTGTTATVASAANTTARRTIRNVGSSAIEIGPSGVTFGQGMPLAAGESFTFDDTGRYTGDIFAVASGGAAWSTATVSY